MNTNNVARTVALGALCTALVTVATMLSVPVPGFRLYFNLGEGVIYTVALLLGRRFGAAAGGLGAALADLLLGYALWAPLTLAIKGVEGFVVGHMAPRGRLVALLCGAAVMITGYTLSAGVLYGWAAAPVELGTDVLQTGAGMLFALFLVPILERRIPLIQKTCTK